jgi:hypothetical protein
MPKNRAKEAKLADQLKKQLEEISGHPTSATVDQLIKWGSSPVGVHYYPIMYGNITYRQFFWPFTKASYGTTLIDASGISATDVHGTVTVLVTSVLWLPAGNASFYEPPLVVATPIGTTPVYLTLTSVLIGATQVSPATDVEITVLSWNANGAAAPNVAFNWRCICPGWIYPS